MLVLTPVAFATSPWSAPSLVDTTFHATSVSCVSSFCAAVDRTGDVITYNGSSWSTPSKIDGTNQLSSVSCVSSSFCVAVDFQGNALMYNGSIWSSAAAIDTNAPSAVSCTSSSFCAAVDNAGDVTTFDGISWTMPTNVDSNQLLSVSCFSSSFCVAVDNGGKATTYTGTSWTAPATIDGTTVLESVTCPSSAFCAALDGAGNALTYNGTSWSAASSTNLESGSALSCTSSSFCAGVDPNGGAATYSSGTWSARTAAERVGMLTSVSCVSTSFCAAVNDAGRIVTYNGSAWTETTAVGGGGILSVSCPSASFCAAVDRNGRALTYNGSTWTAPASIDGTTEMRSVSCPSSSFCVAVDDAGKALFYNGSIWASPATTETPPDQLEAVSCPSSGFCATVDGGSHAVTYNGSWSTATDNLTGGSAVSCTASSFCAAGDFSGGAATFNGSSWSARARASSRAIVSVACFSSTSCIAADSGGRTTTFDGTTWSAPSSVDMHGFMSMSCPVSSFCGAVDQFGSAMTYNGTWSSDGTVDAVPNRLQSISCASSSFCAAVDNNGNALTRSTTSTTGPPANITRPTASGTPQQGQTLTATGDRWTNNPMRFSYQWERCDQSGASCVDITGATQQSYQLVATDVHHRMKVRETATNATTTSAAVESDPTASVAVADFTWTGAASPPSQSWSDAGNWSGAGGTALGANAGTLSFPASACQPTSCATFDDVPNITAGQLDLVDPTAPGPAVGGWGIGGTGSLTLTSGFSSTLQTGSGGSFSQTAIDVPIQLGGDNTWTIGNQTDVRGDLSGSPYALGASLSSVLSLTATSNEVGAFTATGSGSSSALDVGSPSAAGDLNGTDGNAVNVTATTLFGGGTLGPLTAHGAVVEPGYAGGPPRVFDVRGDVRLDDASTADFLNLDPGGAVPEIVATGAAQVAGSLHLSGTCGQPVGTTYTLVHADGGVSGRFNSDVVGGGECTGGGSALTFAIDYSANAVTARVVAPPDVQTDAASSVSQSGAVLNGSVNPNGLDVSDCHFDYGPTPAYGSSTPCAARPGSGASPVSVSAAIGFLSPGITYHVRLVAGNGAGTSVGQDVTFMTQPAPGQPAASDNGAGAPGATCADHEADIGLYQVLTSCFRRSGSGRVTSDRVRVNGLDIYPLNGTQITLDDATHKLSCGLVTIKLGSVPVYIGPLLGALALDLGSQDDLISFNQKPKVAGLPLAATAALKPTELGKLDLDASATIGYSTSALPSLEVSGDLTLHLSNDAGVELGKAKLDAHHIPLGPVKIDELKLSYEHAADGDKWEGEGALAFPGGFPTLGISGTIIDGRLAEIGVSLGDINKPVGAFVYLQKIGVDIAWNPHWKFGGEAVLSAGPEVLGTTALSLDMTLSATFADPFELDLSGKLVVGDRIPLANAQVKWLIGHSFALSGHIGFSAGPASMSVDGAGVVDGKGFYVLAQGQITVPAITAEGIGYVSEKGITACAGLQAGPAGVYGGFGWFWDGRLELWAEDCGMLDFKSASTTPIPTTSSVHKAALPSVTIHVPRGQAQTLFGARGVSAYPSFTLRSPSGQTIVQGAGVQGSVDRGGYRWVTDPLNHGTYVFVAKPTSGDWTLTPTAGSPAIATIGSALSAPTTVRAHVRRRGRAEELTWNSAKVRGQSLRFLEVGAGAGHTLRMTTRANGRLRFIPDDTGHGGRRHIEIEVVRNGLLQAVRPGPSYVVPAPPRPKAPRGIKVTRRGNSAVVSWTRARGASLYDIWLGTSDGRTLFFEVSGKQRSVTIPNVIPPLRVTVSVQSIAHDGLTASPARANRLVRKPGGARRGRRRR